MSELRGFSLSQEELLVALVIGELPAPIGFDDLQTSIFEGIPQEFQTAFLAVAERSLLAHGLLVYEADEPELDPMVSTWLQTISRPQQTWVVLHQPAGQIQQASYIHQGAAEILLHIGRGGIHQLIQLNNLEAIAQTAYQIVDPLQNNVETQFKGILPEAIFREIATKRKINYDQVVEQLLAVGLEAQFAEQFAQSFVELRAITAFARIVHEPNQGVQQAFTLVAGKEQQWILVPESEGQLRLQNLDAAMIEQLLSNFVAPL